MTSIPHFSTATVEGKISRFGGFWTDDLNAAETLPNNPRFKDDPTTLKRFSDWIHNGFVTFESAVPVSVIDTINEDAQKAWSGRFPQLFCEYKGVKKIKPFMREERVKMLDLYTVSEATRQALFCPAVVKFLTQLFEYPPMVFQSLYFEYGSAQRMHQDTAFVKVSSPTKFVGVWIALENIREKSGELEYYTGSHKIAEQIWHGKYKNMPPNEFRKPSHDEFLRSLQTKSNAKGLQRVRHRPRKGDVLIWHSDLVHGGCQDIDPQLTRKSLAAHYCPADITPYYFFTTGGTGPIEYRENMFYSFQHHSVEPPTLLEKMRRKLIAVLGK